MTARLALVGIATVLLAGCGGARSTLDLELRESLTSAPVADARIRVVGLHFFLPVHPYSVVNPFAGADAETRTDEEGRARLSAPPLPWEIVVTAHGESPRSLSLDRAPAPDRWLQLPGDDRGLELRFTTP